MQEADTPASTRGLGQALATNVGRVVVSVFVPIVAFLVLWVGFLFLRDSGADKLVIAAWPSSGASAASRCCTWSPTG